MTTGQHCSTQSIASAVRSPQQRLSSVLRSSDEDNISFVLSNGDERDEDEEGPPHRPRDDDDNDDLRRAEQAEWAELRGPLIRRLRHLSVESYQDAATASVVTNEALLLKGTADPESLGTTSPFHRHVSSPPLSRSGIAQWMDEDPHQPQQQPSEDDDDEQVGNVIGCFLPTIEHTHRIGITVDLKVRS